MDRLPAYGETEYGVPVLLVVSLVLESLLTPDPETCRQVAQWLAESSATVAFTGAGISTESGIPDFRSPGGVWAKYQPVYFDDFMAQESSREEYWRQKSEGLREFSDAMPNAGHQTLAQWESSGRLAAVITQNIDELHQMAGSQHVLELHGTTRKIACMDCGDRFDLEPYTSLFLVTGRVPDCPNCKGRLKHATVSFGQSLPQEVLSEAVALSQQSELFFAIGSSLVVEPAASLPRIAKQHGARLVILNRDPTGLDAIADAVLRASIGEVLSAIDGQLESKL